MPNRWIEPELFLEHNGVAVYHVYEDGGELYWYWYTTNFADDNVDFPQDETALFDIRDLPSGELDANDRQTHEAIIRQAIEAGLITGQPAEQEPPLIVKIEVRGGVAHIVQQPPGVTVELVDLDVKEILAEPAISVDDIPGNGQTGFLTLTRLANRLSYIITDLNGLISAVVNDEVTPADLAGKFADLSVKLERVEAAVQELGDVFWR
jgi:hypothetical protein